MKHRIAAMVLCASLCGCLSPSERRTRSYARDFVQSDARSGSANVADARCNGNAALVDGREGYSPDDYNCAGSSAARTPEQQAALDVVLAVLGGIAAGDQPTVTKHLRPTGTATVIFKRVNKPDEIKNAPLASFGEVYAGKARMEERLYLPQVTVNDGIGSVASNYGYLEDGRLTHCGFAHYDLVQADGSWKIQNVTWTVQFEKCEMPAEALSK